MNLTFRVAMENPRARNGGNGAVGKPDGVALAPCAGLRLGQRLRGRSVEGHNALCKQCDDLWGQRLLQSVAAPPGGQQFNPGQ